MDWNNAILFLHASATLAMTGLIWFVQVVHYPLFSSVDAPSFCEYAAQHVRRTGYVVGPLMLVEVATASWLAIWPSTDEAAITCYAGLALLAVAWLSTALLQVPCHRDYRQRMPDVHRARDQRVGHDAPDAVSGRRWCEATDAQRVKKVRCETNQHLPIRRSLRDPLTPLGEVPRVHQSKRSKKCK
jgi:hypothetical protein